MSINEPIQVFFKHSPFVLGLCSLLGNSQVPGSYNIPVCDCDQFWQGVHEKRLEPVYVCVIVCVCVLSCSKTSVISALCNRCALDQCRPVLC